VNVAGRRQTGAKQTPGGQRQWGEFGQAWSYPEEQADQESGWQVVFFLP